jgi:hypothetical protein
MRSSLKTESNITTMLQCRDTNETNSLRRVEFTHSVHRIIQSGKALSEKRCNDGLFHISYLSR